jgi:hypothetical protein
LEEDCLIIPWIAHRWHAVSGQPEVGQEVREAMTRSEWEG